jgi:hypothetical protein
MMAAKMMLTDDIEEMLDQMADKHGARTVVSALAEATGETLRHFEEKFGLDETADTFEEEMMYWYMGHGHAGARAERLQEATDVWMWAQAAADA